jgi:hypothetical protein
MCWKNIAEKIKTHILCLFFFPKVVLFWENLEKYGTVRQATNDDLIWRKKTWFACRLTKVIMQTGTDNLNTYFKQQYEIFHSSTTVQREPIFAFAWQHWTLLYFCNKIYANYKKGIYCCVFMATVVMRTLGNVKLYVRCQTGCIISVSLSSLYDSDMYCMLLTFTRVFHVSLFPDLISLEPYILKCLLVHRHWRINGRR